MTMRFHRLGLGLGLASLLAACQALPFASAPGAPSKAVNGDFYANVDASGGRSFALETADGKGVGDVTVQIGGVGYRAPAGMVAIPASVVADAKARTRGFVRLFIPGFVPRQVWLGQEGGKVLVARYSVLATEPYVPAAGGLVRAEDGAVALQIGPDMLPGAPTSVALSTYTPPIEAGAEAAQARTDFLAKIRKAGYRLAQAAACEDAEAPLPCEPPGQALGLLVTVNGPLRAGKLTLTYDLDALAAGTPDQAAAARRILQTFQQIDADPAAGQFRAALRTDYGITLDGHTLAFDVPIPADQQADALVRVTVAGFDLLGVQLEVTVTSAIGTSLAPAAAAPGQGDLGSPVATAAIPQPSLIAPHLVANTGSPLISNDGGSLIGQDGAGLIGNDGAGLISNDGAGIITNDGGGLITNDGAGLISNDGGSIVGTVRTPFQPSALVGGNQKYTLQAAASYTDYPFPGAQVSATSLGGHMQFVTADATGHYGITGLPRSNPFIVVMAQCGSAVLAAIAPAPGHCPVTVDINAATTAVTMQVMDQLNRGVHRAPEFSYAKYLEDVAYYQGHLTQAQAQGAVSGLLSSVLGLVAGVLNLLLGSPYQLTCWVPPAPATPAPVTITGNTGAYVAPAVGVPGSAGGADGAAASATFRNAKGLFYDLTGTRMAVGDTYNHKIRLVDFASSPATVTTLAGTGAASSLDGAGASATFNVPKGVCISGNTIFVAEEGGNRVRAVDIASHVVTTVAGNGTAGLADGVGSAARFSAPRGVAVDATGALYVADCGNNVLRKLTSSAGGWQATTVAGASAGGSATGSGAAARFRSPSVLIYDRPHNALLMSDMGNHRIVKIDLSQDPTSGSYVTTFAGTGAAYGSGGPVDGPLLSAQFSGPYGLTVDPSGIVYCTEWTGGVLRRIDPAANQVTTLRAGGFAVSGAVQSFGNPAGVTTDPQGNVYFEEFQRHVIHYAGAAAPGAAPAPNVLGTSTTPATPACP